MADEPLEGQEPGEETITPDETPPVDDDVKDSFLKGDDKDMHRMSSQMGRQKKEMDELKGTIGQMAEGMTQLTQAIQGIQASPTNQKPENQSGSWDQFKAETDATFWDSPTEAVNKILMTYEGLKQDTTVAQKNHVANLVGQLKGPYINEIRGNVQKMAEKLVAEGKDPQTAVELANAKNHSAFSDSLIATINEQSPGTLEMLGGKGKGREDKAPPKQWPEALEKAWERDSKAMVGDKPLFKDKKAYVAAMSPAVRDTYGL